MNRFLSRHWSWLVTLAFGIWVFLFWYIKYPYALAYQEQFQLFLFDDDYLLKRLLEPGGMTRYIGEFLTQFYNSAILGALILALLMMLVQWLTWRLLITYRLSLITYHLSFITSALLWYAMGDENVLLGYIIAMIIALVCGLGMRKVCSGNRVGAIVTMVIGVPLLYWLIGPMAILAVLLASPWWLAVGGALYVAACVLVSGHFLPFPMMRLVLGISYYRVPVTLPYVLMILPFVIVLLAKCVRFLPQNQGDRLHDSVQNQKPVPLIPAIGGIVMVGLLYLAQTFGFDAKKYELIEYDYLVRIRDWNGIITKAEQKTPDLPMSVSATNLALAMTNQLGERAFDFYQRGSEGLFPKLELNFSTAQLTGEIYFHLGLVNTAQRYAFESMESLPNYNKSARVMKRLAETNLINGEYEVARKYLRMLEKTVFYRPWARRTMAMLGNEKQIDAHPLYGTLRQYRLQEDFLFSEQELDKICGQLFLHNQQNLVAMQYLLMEPLLERDVPRFMQYAQWVQQQRQYNPRAVQETIAFAFAQQRRQVPPGLVSPMVLQQFNEFSRLWHQCGKDSPELQSFRHTAWYYLLNH